MATDCTKVVWAIIFCPATLPYRSRMTARLKMMPRPTTRPCTVRRIHRCSMRVASRLSSEVSTSTTSPMNSGLRRPQASESTPCHRHMKALATKNSETVCCTAVAEVPRSCWMDTSTGNSMSDHRMFSMPRLPTNSIACRGVRRAKGCGLPGVDEEGMGVSALACCMGRTHDKDEAPIAGETHQREGASSRSGRLASSTSGLAACSMSRS